VIWDAIGHFQSEDFPLQCIVLDFPDIMIILLKIAMGWKWQKFYK